MRPIKFRAKGLEEGELIYFDLFDITNAYREDDVLYVKGHPIDYTTVQQFTGLLDKNGKEIYEGDILRNDWGGEIESVDDIRSIDWLLSDGWMAGQSDDNLQVEVIGNIYENSDVFHKEATRSTERV